MPFAIDNAWMSDFSAPREVVIERDYVVALLNKALTQPRADEARSASDECDARHERKLTGRREGCIGCSCLRGSDCRVDAPFMPINSRVRIAELWRRGGRRAFTFEYARRARSATHRSFRGKGRFGSTVP